MWGQLQLWRWQQYAHISWRSLGFRTYYLYKAWFQGEVTLGVALSEFTIILKTANFASMGIKKGSLSSVKVSFAHIDKSVRAKEWIEEVTFASKICGKCRFVLTGFSPASLLLFFYKYSPTNFHISSNRLCRRLNFVSLLYSYFFWFFPHKKQNLQKYDQRTAPRRGSGSLRSYPQYPTYPVPSSQFIVISHKMVLTMSARNSVSRSLPQWKQLLWPYGQMTTPGPAHITKSHPLHANPYFILSPSSLPSQLPWTLQLLSTHSYNRLINLHL